MHFKNIKLLILEKNAYHKDDPVPCNNIFPLSQISFGTLNTIPPEMLKINQEQGIQILLF